MMMMQMRNLHKVLECALKFDNLSISSRTWHLHRFSTVISGKQRQCETSEGEEKLKNEEKLRGTV